MLKDSGVAYLNPLSFNRISHIFGMGQGLYFNCLFNFRKSIKDFIRFVFDVGWEKEGAPHLYSFASVSTPNFISLMNSFLNIASFTLGTG